MASTDILNSTTTSSTSTGGAGANGIYYGTDSTKGKATDSNDVIFQNISVYIEGVQVPYVSVSISQNIGALPEAFIEVPPSPALMDIARYYQPKVHIFYTDRSLGGERLLFWGHVSAVGYQKTVQARSASSSISFQCKHKNYFVEQVTLEWSNFIANTQTGTDPNTNYAVSPVFNFNSQFSIISALTGISGIQTDAQDLLASTNKQVANADTSKLGTRFKSFLPRYKGMVSCVMNFWNQLKKQCFMMPYQNLAMQDMYIPLIEDGIGYFDRISGHPYLENIIDASKQDSCVEKPMPDGSKAPAYVLVPPVARMPSISAAQATMGINSIYGQLGPSGEQSTFGQLFRDFYHAVEYEMVTLASPASVNVDPTQSSVSSSASANSTSTAGSSTTSSTSNTMAIETIIKPQMPFYYSPACNVILPRMFHTINIQQDEASVPSRITAYHDLMPTTPSTLTSNYYAPASVREAVAIGLSLVQQNAPSSTTAININLEATTGPHYNIPGKYEWGRGINNRKISLPQWLCQYAMDKAQSGMTTDEVFPAKSSQEYNDMMNLYAAWAARYGVNTTENDGQLSSTVNMAKDTLNPFSQNAGVHSYERLLFMAADYEFSKAVAASRTGTIEGVFNPYIVPGYPMDVIDDSPNSPCFHGMCSSVTHTFTTSSMSTTIGMVGAMTYAEMSNYYMVPLHPFLQTSLKMINVKWATKAQTQSTASSDSNQNGFYDGQNMNAAGQTDATASAGTASTPDSSVTYGDVSTATEVAMTLLANPTAKSTADTFYQGVFGVGSVAPDSLYDFTNGQVLPISSASSGSNTTQTGSSGITGAVSAMFSAVTGSSSDYNSTVGNLRIVARPIESKDAISGKFSYTFIDLTPQNYSNATIPYQNPEMQKDMLLEPGASLFLDYEETENIVDSASTTTSTPQSTSGA